MFGGQQRFYQPSDLSPPIAAKEDGHPRLKVTGPRTSLPGGKELQGCYCCSERNPEQTNDKEVSPASPLHPAGVGPAEPSAAHFPESCTDLRNIQNRSLEVMDDLFPKVEFFTYGRSAGGLEPATLETAFT